MTQCGRSQNLENTPQMAWNRFAPLVLVIVALQSKAEELPTVNDCEQPAYSLEQYESDHELMLELDVKAYKECLFYVAFRHEQSDDGNRLEIDKALAEAKTSHDRLVEFFVSLDSNLQQRMIYWRSEVDDYFEGIRSEEELRGWLDKRDLRYSIPGKTVGFCAFLETVESGHTGEPIYLYFVGGFKSHSVVWTEVTIGLESSCS